MTIDKFDLLGPAYDRIGQEDVRLAGGVANKLLLYVEIGDGWVEPSIFKDEGAAVRYIDPFVSATLDQMLTDAWCLEPADKRWTALRYTIDQGKFRAEFEFDDLEKSEENTGDRRERVLHGRFGDKPVIYPPLPLSGWELKR